MWLVRILVTVVLALGGLMVIESCKSSSDPASVSESKVVTATPTFNADVGPLLQAKCMKCHADGAVKADMQFNTFASAQKWASLIVSAVNAHQMPPWPMASGNSVYAPGANMPDFQNARELTAAEINLINRWVKEGQPEGPGGLMTFKAPPSNTLTGSSVKRLTMPQSFTPKPEPGLLDQYRCFILNPISATSDAWVTAYQLDPDSFQELHHAIVFIPSSPTDLQTARALETTPGQGYDCWTGPGANVNAEILALWAPGTGVNRFPDNTAIKVPAGIGLILQIHYSTRSGATPDQTSILLDSQPSQGSLTQAHFFPAGVGVPQLTIPLNQKDAQFPLTKPVQDIFGVQSVAVYGVYPHEHRLGTRVHAEYQIGGQGKLLPMFDDYPWDFNWQDGYSFAKPLKFSGKDTITVTCHYDTTLDGAGNDITGTHRTAPVNFGDFTTDEMCFAFIFGVIQQ